MKVRATRLVELDRLVTRCRTLQGVFRAGPPCWGAEAEAAAVYIHLALGEGNLAAETCQALAELLAYTGEPRELGALQVQMGALQAADRALEALRAEREGRVRSLRRRAIWSQIPGAVAGAVRTAVRWWLGAAQR